MVMASTDMGEDLREKVFGSDKMRFQQIRKSFPGTRFVERIFGPGKKPPHKTD